MFSGKIASGKSTLAAQLAATHECVILSEDHLLSRLYPGEVTTIEDYVRVAGRLRSAIETHVEELLRQGIDVVLDFQANTPAARAWMRRLFEGAGAEHQLHYIVASNEACKKRLRRRNEDARHEYQVSEAEFDLFTSHFVAPAGTERFNVVLHR